MADVFGVKEVKKLFEDAGKAPAKVLTTATKKAARVVLKHAKAHCPESIDGKPYGKYPHEPGNLKRSLRILRKEKRKKGKSVYQVGPDASGWYAHFADYGFTDPAGVKWEGNKFLRNSIDENRTVLQETMLNEMGRELDKLR